MITDPDIPGCGDPDDIKALCVAAQAHRSGALRLRGVIGTARSAVALEGAVGWRRPALARAVMKHLGCSDVPVGIGGCKEATLAGSHTFPGYFPDVEASEMSPACVLLQKVFENAKPASLTVVAIAAMDDLATFIAEKSDLVARKLSRVFVQGGIVQNDQGDWEPDTSGNVAGDARPAALAVYAFCCKRGVPLSIYSREAVPKLPMALAKSLLAANPEDALMRFLVEAQERGLVDRVWKGVAQQRKRWFFTTFCGVSDADFDADPSFEAMNLESDIRPFLSGHVKPYDVCAIMLALPDAQERFALSPHVINSGSENLQIFQDPEHMIELRHVEVLLRSAFTWACHTAKAQKKGK